MRNETLLELVKKWKRDAVQNGITTSNEVTKCENSASVARLSCAEDLEKLIKLLE